MRHHTPFGRYRTQEVAGSSPASSINGSLRSADGPGSRWTGAGLEAHTGMAVTELLARSCSRHPWRTIGAWIGAVVLAIAALALVFGSLTTNGHPTNDPESQRADEMIARSLCRLLARYDRSVVARFASPSTRRSTGTDWGRPAAQRAALKTLAFITRRATGRRSRATDTRCSSRSSSRTPIRQVRSRTWSIAPTNLLRSMSV
jgi:hypothetical protein